ncbi:MAG: urease accessory UreF family protein [Pseudomonadota bacterium]
MINQTDLMTLLQVTDSTFPTGAFGFSGGLERLTGDGWIKDAGDLTRVLMDELVPRWFEFDRYYLCHAHRAGGDLARLSELDGSCDAQMYTPALRDASLTVGRGILSSHARRGTTGMSDLLAATQKGDLFGHAAIVQGATGYALGLEEKTTEVGALHGLLMSHVSAAVRLGSLGALEALPVLSQCAEAAASKWDDSLPDHPHSFSPFLDTAASRKAPNGAQLFAN